MSDLDRSPRARTIPALGLIAWLVAGATPGAPQALADAADDRPAAGRLLIANRDLRSPMFGRSVVLLLHDDATGAMGLILNRASDVSVADLLPQLGERPGSDTLLRVGGPVARRSVHLLVRADDPPEGARRVLDDVYYSREWELLRDLVDAEEGGPTYRVYVGYSGWAPGQLDAEIARGDWLVTDASADDVFRGDGSGPWRRRLPRDPRTWTRRLDGRSTGIDTCPGCGEARAGAPASPSGS